MNSIMKNRKYVFTANLGTMKMERSFCDTIIKNGRSSGLYLIFVKYQISSFEEMM